jgi:AraC-like DNA-binding protein
LLKINAKTFNPEILYVFDGEAIGPMSGKKHFHDFFEISLILEGDSDYFIDGEIHHLKANTILLFNPGIEHYDFIPKGKKNRQMHIGIRHFTIDRFPQDYFPLDTTILHLSEHKEAFFQTCQEIIQERRQAEVGYEIILKSLILKLIVYILRDSSTDRLENKSLLLSDEQREKQALVDEIKLYIEKNYKSDLSLKQISEEFFTSPATVSRIFKEHLGDTPINYLIQYRMKKAEALIERNEEVSVTEVANLIGYKDAYYFSKLFKKYYGSSPTKYSRRVDK